MDLSYNTADYRLQIKLLDTFWQRKSDQIEKLKEILKANRGMTKAVIQDFNNSSLRRTALYLSEII